jgi:predicted alpha/beta hydrolase family esterase
MKRNIFIFHGTEGYPEENWFPWMKHELEERGHQVFVPQFPSPPVVPAKISEWFDVLKEYEQYINPEAVLIGHSLGGIFTLRVLEQLHHSISVAAFVGTPIGVHPIANYDRDNAFSGFAFNWENIRGKANNFIVFQSDNDPYVGLENGQRLATHLGVELDFVPKAGHFNKKAGYVTFESLRDRLLPLL